MSFFFYWKEYYILKIDFEQCALLSSSTTIPLQEWDKSGFIFMQLDSLFSVTNYTK